MNSIPKYFPLHSARLVAITQPTEEIRQELGVDSAEGLTAYVARVSNPSNQSSDNIKGLLSYCAKNAHWSIFETCYMTVEIKTTRDISAQIIRHRSFCVQEFSQRYSNATDFEYPEMRIQDVSNRQNSIDIVAAYKSGDLSGDSLDSISVKTDQAYRAIDQIFDIYNNLLSLGVAKETARRILPLSTHTRMYFTGSIRSFIFYIMARNSADGKAQKEHQMVADSVEEIFKEQFPIIYAAIFKR